ncbi:MAG: hypothetical protein N2554_01135 [Fimbriimonadales bacterium]|nr:hypothetical protein [Fimbriimonadales bacterium]
MQQVLLPALAIPCDLIAVNGKGYNPLAASRFAAGLLPKPAAKPLLPPAPVSPDERAILASLIAAALAPRAAGVLLPAPFQWAERENRRRMQQYESELNRQLKEAQLQVERLKARTPIEVEQIREAGRAAERTQQQPKIDAEVGKIQAETQNLQQRTEQAAQRLPVEISLRIADLLQRAGDEKVGAEERRMMIGYARYLMQQYGVDLKDFLPAETQASPAQARAAAQAVGEAAQAEQALASAERMREEAETERQERPLRLEERRARIRLIQAQELTERMQPQLMQARIQEIRANIAQGWQNLRLRAQALQNAIQRQDWNEARGVVEAIGKSRAFWERQVQELRKALGITQERTEYITPRDPQSGATLAPYRQITRTTTLPDLSRIAQSDPRYPLVQQLREAERLANFYRQSEQILNERLMKRRGIRVRWIPMPDGTQIPVWEEEN